MPRKGEGKSVRINPDVYEALLLRKHGMMTVSDVIGELIQMQTQAPGPAYIMNPLPLPEPKEK